MLGSPRLYRHFVPAALAMNPVVERLAALGWLLPDWPAPAGVFAVCSTRAGGVSAGPWDSMNLGDHVGDAPAAVAANRARLRQAVGADPVFMRQPHGTDCVDLDSLAPGAVPSADACTSTTPGRACTVMVADCLPVLLCDREGMAVAAAHAGWRGLAAGVLEGCVRSLRGRLGRPDAELMAWLGPCIGPTAFEVGDEVRQAFVAGDADAAGCFRPGAAPGKWFADLAALARRRLLAAGVGAVHGNDGGGAWCTVGDASRFFSHRRDAAVLGTTGRLAASIWRRV